MPRTHRPYPPEFRAEAVRLARSSGKSLPALAADLGVSTQRRHSTLACLTPVAHEEQRLLLLLQDLAA